MWLIAHRGDPKHAPENTLASFRQAVARGARAVEMDVRRCADGVWVVLHDPALGCSTDLPGSIPRVSEVLALCRSRRVQAFLDVKQSFYEEELAQIVKRSGWLHQTVLLAGRAESLRRWRKLLPHRPLFQVTGFRVPITREAIAQARRMKLAGFVGYRRWVNRQTIDWVHQAGLRMIVWTVRTPADLKRYARLGVDGMMSEI